MVEWGGMEKEGLDIIVGLDEEGLIDNVSKEEGLKMFMELVSVWFR